MFFACLLPCLGMTKKVFVKFVSDPAHDRMKSIVGLACAAQAVNDGHDVSVFFAAAGVRLLDPHFLGSWNHKWGPTPRWFTVSWMRCLRAPTCTALLVQ